MKMPIFPHPCQHLLLLTFAFKRSTGCDMLLSWFIASWGVTTWSIFSCARWLCVYLLWRVSFKYRPIFKLVVCCWAVSILCFLDRSALSGTWLANIFSHSVHIFSLSWWCLLNHRSCNLMSILPIFFPLHYLWFWDVSRNHCPTPNHDFLFLFFLKSFYRV